MAGKKQSWYEARLNPTTRARSSKQEKRTAKELRGYATFNSGATLGENDVITDSMEIECKITSKGSFSVKLSDMEILQRKCHVDKMPIMTVEFEQTQKTYAILDYEDLKHLIKTAKF